MRTFWRNYIFHEYSQGGLKKNFNPPPCSCYHKYQARKDSFTVLHYLGAMQMTR